MANKNNLVSIIMPAYNAQRFLSESISSVLAQSYKTWELLVIDDGSTDDTAKIAASFAEKDSRIRLVSQQNRGSAAARNHGLSLAGGRFIALLDSDDLWDPEFLSSQLRLLKQKQCCLVFSAYRFIDENGTPTGQVIRAPKAVTLADMEIRNYVGCLTALYDTAEIGKLYFDESLGSLRDDYAYFLEIVRRSQKAYGNPHCLASYRVLPGSTTGNKAKLVKVQFSFYRNYLRLPLWKCLRNTAIWGIAGVLHFYTRHQRKDREQ